MSDKQDSAQPPTDVVALRQRAEAQVRNMASPAPAAHTPEEIQQMLHELRVHQIELTRNCAGPRRRSKPNGRAILISTIWPRQATAPSVKMD